MMGLYEKNLEALNKRFPGMDKLIEEKKDEKECCCAVFLFLKKHSS